MAEGTSAHTWGPKLGRACTPARALAPRLSLSAHGPSAPMSPLPSPRGFSCATPKQPWGPSPLLPARHLYPRPIQSGRCILSLTTSTRLRFPAGAWCDGQQEAGPQTSTGRKGLGTGSHSCQVMGRPASELPTVNMAGPHHGTQGGRGGPVACFRNPGWPGVSDTCPHVGTALEREATRPWGWWPSLSSGPKAPGRTLVCACC